MRQKQAYSHEDISVLAKSLKKQIEASGKLPGHVELLNMLAKAIGFQNYSSWQSNRRDQTSSPLAKVGATPSVNAVVRVLLNFPAMEVYERDHEGNPVDRRQKSVSRVFALIDVILRLPNSPDGVIRLRVSCDADLLDPEREPDNWFKEYLPAALVDLVHGSPEEISIFKILDVSIDRYVMEGRIADFQDRKVDVQVKLDEESYERLRKECKQAERASLGFEHVKEILLELLGLDYSTALARARKLELVAIAKYLEEYIEASGEMFMYDWNQEKLGGIATLLKVAASAPERVDPGSWTWARQDIFVATPPSHWKTTVHPPKLLVS